QTGDEPLALFPAEVDGVDGLREQLAAGFVSEDPRQRVVHIEKAPIQRGAEHAGQIALEEQTVALFAVPQLLLRAMALRDIDGDDQPRPAAAGHELKRGDIRIEHRAVLLSMAEDAAPIAI